MVYAERRYMVLMQKLIYTYIFAVRISELGKTIRDQTNKSDKLTEVVRKMFLGPEHSLRHAQRDLELALMTIETNSRLFPYLPGKNSPLLIFGKQHNTRIYSKI